MWSREKGTVTRLKPQTVVSEMGGEISTESTGFVAGFIQDFSSIKVKKRKILVDTYIIYVIELLTFINP